MDWRKSSYSGANGGQCVEVATIEGVAVRDTTQAGTGPVLMLTADAWRDLLASIKNG